MMMDISQGCRVSVDKLGLVAKLSGGRASNLKIVKDSGEDIGNFVVKNEVTGELFAVDVMMNQIVVQKHRGMLGIPTGGDVIFASTYEDIEDDPDISAFVDHQTVPVYTDRRRTYY